MGRKTATGTSRSREQIWEMEREHWRLLVDGTLALLDREEPRAFRRLMLALRRHGLAGSMMDLSRDRQTGRLLPYSEHVRMTTGVTDDFRTLPPALRQAVLTSVRAFAANPYMGRLRGKDRRRKVDDRELLIAYQAARWKIQRDAQAGRARVRGAEALSELAHAAVAQHYGLTAETVRSFLQDARAAVPPKTQKVIARLRGETAWGLTLGASNSGD
jgi:hypothetical protein